MYPPGTLIHGALLYPGTNHIGVCYPGYWLTDGVIVDVPEWEEGDFGLWDLPPDGQISLHPADQCPRFP